MTDTNATPGRELGYGNVDARIDERPPTSADPAAGGESGGGARPEPVENTGGSGSPGGQTDPAYRGGDNPNSVREERDA